MLKNLKSSAAHQQQYYNRNIVKSQENFNQPQNLYASGTSLQKYLKPLEKEPQLKNSTVKPPETATKNRDLNPAISYETATSNQPNERRLKLKNHQKAVNEVRAK